MNENYNTPNSGCCGRPMHYDTTPKCKYSDCCLNEYAYKQKACIRNKQPDCEAQAVIPSITVETVDGITNLANCFVHVTSINTTFYVDDKHRPMIIWAGSVDTVMPADVHTDEEFYNFLSSFNLRSQFLYAKYFSQETNKYMILSAYFDNTGKIYYAGEFKEITEPEG